MITIRPVENLEMVEECHRLLEDFALDDREFDENIRRDYHPHPRYQEIYLRSDRLLILAYLEDQAVGYLEGSYWEKNQEVYTLYQVAYLNSLYVSKEFRHQGVGRALLESFFEWGKQKGATLAELSVFTKNETAIDCYQKAGFEPTISYLKKRL